VIAVSEATRRDVVQRLGFPEERTSVVYHGVPVHFSAAPAGLQDSVRVKYGLEDRPFLLFVGEVAARKNVLRLVDAFADAVRESPDAHLVLAGSPGLGYDRLKERVAACAPGSITLAGHAPQQEVEGLMACAHALVLPSLDEGFGFPALEAMSVGTPVIAADAASLPEVVDGAGLLVPPLDREAIASAMHRVLTDDGLRDRLSHRGRERAATFTWRRTAEQTLEAYGNALGT
jgi:glycosyltransferase involved in cell wall biosynthesis